MTILGIAGSLRAGSLNAQLLRLAAEELPEGVELELFDGLAEIPPTTRTSRTLPPTPSSELKDGDRRGGRGPDRDAGVQRLDPGPAQERARLGLPADRGDADPEQARRRDRREHRSVRRDLGAAGAEEGARADGRSRRSTSSSRSPRPTARLADPDTELRDAARGGARRARRPLQTSSGIAA